jgi:O-antigen/teichoic acid export membrane protein
MLVMINAANIRIKPKIIKNLILEEHKYGLIIYFSALFIFLNYRVDQLFIKHYLSMSDLGVYSVGVMIAELIFLIPTSVQLALDSRFYNMTKDSVERIAITKITIRYTFYLCLIIVFIGSALTPLIPIVYGKEFAEASMITVILFWGVVFASIGKVSASYFFSQGRPHVHLVNTLITFLVNISLNIVLIPRFGIRGAAIASSIAYLVYGGSYIIYFIRKESFRLYDFFVLSKDDKILIRKIFFRLLRLGGK